MLCPRANPQPAQATPPQGQPQAPAPGHRSLLTATLLALALTLTACWDRTPEEIRTLRIDRTSPTLNNPNQPILLNDALTIYFSEPLRTRTITPDSVTLVDEDGLSVRGELDVGSNWVAFRPDPPLDSDLMDGSYRPGGRYRLMLAGHPRPDAIRAKDGRWLSRSHALDVYVADRDQIPTGLPSILRPPNRELPFGLLHPEVVQPIAADAPVLQLHFTVPPLPSSVTPDAFFVRLLAGQPETITPRSVRVVTSPIDEHPGATVEIDIGSLPRPRSRLGGPFEDSRFLIVTLAATGNLVDYAGRLPLPWKPLYWNVVPGDSVPLLEWPGDADAFADEQGLQPGFEVLPSRRQMQPRVRAEAGNGQLGAFRPTRDVTLRAGDSVDAGGGRIVLGNGGVFDFTLIEIPKGVTVTLDARAAPVCLRACGGMRVRGSLRVVGPLWPVPERTLAPTAVESLLGAAAAAVCVAGDVELAGDVVHETAPSESQTGLLLATSGHLYLGGALPFQALLAVEQRSGDQRARIHGPRGQARPVAVRFTPGMAPSTVVEAVAELPWQQLPAHRDGGRIEFDADPELRIEWQVAPPDAIRADRPDRSPGRVSRWRTAQSGDVVFAGAGAFVRCRVMARVRDGRALPQLRRLRLVEN